MPWKETSAVEERNRFVLEWKTGLYTMTELCELYGVSRPTGYKWSRRYAESGLRGLEDLSRAPRSCPPRVTRPSRDASGVGSRTRFSCVFLLTTF